MIKKSVFCLKVVEIINVFELIRCVNDIFWINIWIFYYNKKKLKKLKKRKKKNTVKKTKEILYRASQKKN